MNNNLITVRTRTNFTALPNEFARNQKLSLEAKGLALFLQSLPDGWKIHPKWVKEQTGIRDWTWRRLSNELKKHGTLKFYAGGTEGGSYYTFDEWQVKEDLKQYDAENPKATKEADSLVSHTPPPTRWKTTGGGVGNQRPYKEINKINKTNTTTTNKAAVVLRDLKISEEDIQACLLVHSEEECLRHAKAAKAKAKTSPAGYFFRSIKNNWQHTESEEPKKPTNPHLTVEETQKTLLNAIDGLERRSSVEEASKHLSVLKKKLGRTN